MYSIDYLRKNIIKEKWPASTGIGSPAQPYYHGLGCIRLPMQNKTFINFYSKNLTPETKFIHTHRENLWSKSLHGSYKNILYDVNAVDYESEWKLEFINCTPGGWRKVIHDNVGIKEMDFFILQEYDEIFHFYNDFHDLELLTDHVITEVRFDFTPPYPTKYRFSIFPKLVLPKKQTQVNALENYGDPKDNWEIIREILNEI
tara:strand:- start:635 stop:1240 length:606 start_codon:yes stop_codon:yes gene_type:complete